MISPRPSLSNSYSSTSSSDGDVFEGIGKPASSRSLPPKSTVNVRSVVVQPGATVPGVLEGTINQVNFNVLVNSGDVTPGNVDELVTNANKINSETYRSFFSSNNDSSFKNLIGTKEDVEGLSRKWCYLITALVILSLITLLGTAVLSVTSWKSSQVSELDPAIQTTVDGLSAEEKHFAEMQDGPMIVRRSMWLAANSREPIERNRLPVTLVVVYHTGTHTCSFQPQCIRVVKSLQRSHQRSHHWADVGYNFMIGGEGSVYWGRGFSLVGAFEERSKEGSVSVAFIGNFTTGQPNANQIKGFNKLMYIGVKEGKIAPDYTLVAECQLTEDSAVVRSMATWPHYNSSHIGCPAA